MAHSSFFGPDLALESQPVSLPQFQLNLHLQVVFLHTLQGSEMMGDGSTMHFLVLQGLKLTVKRDE